MFDSIVFDLNPHFGYSAAFVHFSLHTLSICYARCARCVDQYARCAHSTVPSRRRDALFFLWEQMCTSGSTFTKKIKTFVCYYISIHNTISLSCHEQVCLSGQICHEQVCLMFNPTINTSPIIPPNDGRSISRNIAQLNILVHDMINFLYYR